MQVTVGHWLGGADATDVCGRVFQPLGFADPNTMSLDIVTQYATDMYYSAATVAPWGLCVQPLPNMAHTCNVGD